MKELVDLNDVVIVKLPDLKWYPAVIHAFLDTNNTEFEVITRHGLFRCVPKDENKIWRRTDMSGVVLSKTMGELRDKANRLRDDPSADLSTMAKGVGHAIDELEKVTPNRLDTLMGLNLDNPSVKRAFKNVGVDVECGACAETFFTGTTFSIHSCGGLLNGC